MRAAIALFAAALSGCTSVPPAEAPAAAVSAFSANTALDGFPRGWRPWIINRAKKPTEYQLVRDSSSGVVILHAKADAAASGLRQLLRRGPPISPLLRWRSRVWGAR